MFWKVLRSRRGAVSIFAAVMIPTMAGMSGLATEYGYALLTRVETQRVADLAAYGGAIAYGSAATTAAMNAAVSRVVTLNGFASSSAVASLTNSPTNDGNQAVTVTITSNVPRLLSSLVSSGSQISVTATSYAELGSNGPACVIALNGSGTGVTLSGGTSLSAPGCAVASNNTVTAPCGTTLTTPVLDYDSAGSPSECTSPINIVAPTGKSLSIAKKSTTDPLNGNSSVTAAMSRVTGTVASLNSPSNPTVTPPTLGKPIEFGYSPSSTQSQATALGCTATVSGSTWALICPNGGTYTFSSLVIDGGINLNFNATGSGTSTYKFSSAVSTSATTNFGPGTYVFTSLTTAGTTTFGAGTYSIAGAFNLGGGATTTFGAGTFNIPAGINTGGGTSTHFGAGTFNLGNGVTCGGVTKYSICNTGTLVFAGPSTFVMAGAISNGGGATLTFGSGTSNSYQIGRDNSGNSFLGGGGAITTFADASTGGGVFQAAGSINNASGGGSCLTLPATAQHDINGSISSAGGLMLGAGVYSVNGYFALGVSGGGTVSCTGNPSGNTTVGMYGSRVTLVLSGASTICSGQAFCISGGFGYVTLTSPGSGSNTSLAVIGPLTGSARTGGATFTAGANNTSISGAFYFPNGPISFSGAAGVGSGSGHCLELIGSTVTMSGGATLASSCTGLGGSSSGSTIALVQ